MRSPLRRWLIKEITRLDAQCCGDPIKACNAEIAFPGFDPGEGGCADTAQASELMEIDAAGLARLTYTAPYEGERAMFHIRHDSAPYRIR